VVVRAFENSSLQSSALPLLKGDEYYYLIKFIPSLEGGGMKKRFGYKIFNVRFTLILTGKRSKILCFPLTKG